ncbi:MAG: hypothetical protein AABZ08_09370 [Planctomycetota bacterium]
MDTTTMTGGQVLQGGLAEILVSLIQLFFNIVAISFQTVLSGFFSAINLGSIFQM